MKPLLSLLLILLLAPTQTFAQQATNEPATTVLPTQIEPVAASELVILKEPENQATYLLSPGDALEITVWKEEGLQQQQFLIGPDGHIIYPLIGTIAAAGRTIHDLNELISHKLADFISDPSVSVKLLNVQGNAIFVIGKVNKPGMVLAGRRIDVLQALSLAGGLTVFANEGSISVQRRIGNQIKVFPFDYSNVIDGDDLEQNILLEPGDTVTVP